MKWLGVRSLLKTTSRQDDTDVVYSSSPSSSPPTLNSPQREKKSLGSKTSQT